MKVLDWLDNRTGYRALIHEALDEKVVGGARLAYVWGSALTLSFMVQAVTGILLMTAYQPSATTAWSSVMYISHQMTWGWIIRGLHHYGAQGMVILLFVHLGQTVLFGAYKKPREMNWLLGLGLMGLTLGFALTGYLLPWDQKGYWATKVATNIAGTMPGFGQASQRVLVGGSDYGHMTLTRFYALHVAVLPIGLVALIGAHIALFRKHGVTPGRKADLKKVDGFFPKQLGLDLLVGGVVLAVLFGLTIANHGAHLDAPADPASNYPARPEWYFLSLFEALKHMPASVPEWVVATGIPVVVLGYLAALPFIDKDKGASLLQRLPKLSPLLIFGAAAAGLTWLSMSTDAANPDFAKAREVASQRAERAIFLAKQGVPPEGPLAMMANDPETRGPELYDKHCGVCHKLNERGPEPGKETAPNLTGFGTESWVLAVLDNPDSDHLFGKTAFKGMMESVTRKPSDPAMAEYFTAMKKEDMATIAGFLAGEAREETGKHAAGEKMVRQRCTSCHRMDGKTDDDNSLAPELRGWGSKAWISAQISNPGSGKTYTAGSMAEDMKGHMPAFAEQLSEKDIKLLTTWVYDQGQKGKAVTSAK